jgi:2',3'-cyclic-nucleotide 2'-phosphodiesterase (5'-nucleotidase family)
MNKRQIAAVAVLFGLSGLGMDRCGGSGGGGSAVELTLFHTNDIHSHNRAAKAEPFGLGGVARLATLLKTLRKENPVSLTLDAGDYSEGTWYFSVDTGASMLKMLDAMKYDAVALGNHDYLMGPDELLNTIHNANVSFPVLAGNLDPISYSRPEEFSAALPATTIKTVGGIKVGIIGLTTFQFAYNNFLLPVVVQNIEDVAVKHAKELRPQVDVLILLSHNNYDMNQQLARNVPGVDIVISGHSHKKVPQAVFETNAGRQVPIVEVGQWAQFLGDLKVSVTPRNGSTPPVVKFASYQIHPVTSDIAEDPVIAQMIDAQDAYLSNKFGKDVLNTVVAHADSDVLGSTAGESPMGNLAAKAFRESSGAEVALELASLTGTSIAKGPVTLMDAHDVAPHIYNPVTDREWALRVWNVKGSDLSLVFNAFYTGTAVLGWLTADNANIVWNASLRAQSWDELATSSSARSPRIESITIGGVPLDPAKRYKVALSDGILLSIRLANELLHLGIDLSDIQDTGMDTWQSVTNYITKAGRIKATDYRVGERVFAKTADLAIYDYAFDWNGSALTLEVKNVGLQASAGGSLGCATGLPNDFVAYETELQEWTSLPAASVPALAPGATATVTVPWSAQDLVQGYWPVSCTVQSAGDSFGENDSARKVFKI